MKDTTGGSLQGVMVHLKRDGTTSPMSANTNGAGQYQFDAVPPGRRAIEFSLINFAPLTRKEVRVLAGRSTAVDVVLQLMLNADVTVTGKQTFVNLADV